MPAANKRPRLLGSLQARVMALTLACVLLTAISSIWLIAKRTQHELDELLDAHLAQAAALLVVQGVHELDEEHGSMAPSLHRYAPRVVFQVYEQGQLLVQSGAAPAAPLADLQRSSGSAFSTRTLDGQDWRVFTTVRSLSADEDDAHDGARTVHIVVAERLTARNSIIRALLKSVSATQLLLLPLLLLLTWLLLRWALAPLQLASRALLARSAHELTPLTLPQTTTDVQTLLDAINTQLERVAALLHTERRFTADAAHELRTPIAAIRTQAQVALAAQADEAARTHALRSVMQGCDRASHLVTQLLTLSRLESGEQQLPLQTVDAAALVRQVAADMAPQALQKAQVLELEAPQTLPLRAEPTLLAVLLRNLLDNAVRYSPQGAQIHLQLEALSATHVRLRVQDSGPGLDSAALARVGERFFRVLGNDAAGSGLGLSIVQRIVAVHGGQLAVQRAAQLGGLEVTVHLPSI